MLILKRKDVDIANVQHPKREQAIPILNYQGQTFRLISVFSANQEDEARGFWRDLTDNQGKFCVLLEETERFSVWGKIRVEQLGSEEDTSSRIVPLTQACIILMQTAYFDLEDLYGARQAEKFTNDLMAVLQQWHFPGMKSVKDLGKVIDLDPLDGNVPAWEEHHLITLLQELYRIGKAYFGNDSFAEGIGELLADMPADDRKFFTSWLAQSPLGQMWR
jgi:hypothetical protein